MYERESGVGDEKTMMCSALPTLTKTKQLIILRVWKKSVRVLGFVLEVKMDKLKSF